MNMNSFFVEKMRSLLYAFGIASFDMLNFSTCTISFLECGSCIAPSSHFFQIYNFCHSKTGLSVFSWYVISCLFTLTYQVTYVFAIMYSHRIIVNEHLGWTFPTATVYFNSAKKSGYYIVAFSGFSFTSFMC